MAYLWFKAFHLIGIVVWFAGLFYLVRLFVYHAEANQEPEPAQTILKKQYEIMEKRLYHLITMPGMTVTVVMAMVLTPLTIRRALRQSQPACWLWRQHWPRRALP